MGSDLIRRSRSSGTEAVVGENGEVGRLPTWKKPYAFSSHEHKAPPKVCMWSDG